MTQTESAAEGRVGGGAARSIAGCGSEGKLLMFVLCLSVTTSHVTRGPEHSHSKQAPLGRLMPNTAHERERRPSTFLGQRESSSLGDGEATQARERRPAQAQSPLHPSAEQPNSLVPCLPPNRHSFNISILWEGGREGQRPISVALTCVWASPGVGGPVCDVPEKQFCPLLPSYPLLSQAAFPPLLRLTD